MTERGTMVKDLIVSFLVLLSVILFSDNSFAQGEEKKKDVERPFMKYLSWTLLQAVPSPVYNHDANETDGRLSFGLKWNIVPVNISFNANKYVSPVQFFMVNPVRRLSGSIEIFAQPEVSTAGFDYAGYDNFGISSGLRFTFPIKHYGEHLAGSVGAKWFHRNSDTGSEEDYYGMEGGLYFLNGVFGLQGSYNFNRNSTYSISLNFKYY
jgi:hypothetical protein